MFLSPPKTTSQYDLAFLARMDSGYYRGSYNPRYKILDFPASYTDHGASSQDPYSPTYQTTPPDPTAVPPTQPGYVWNIRNSLGQALASPPMIPLVDPMSPRASEGGCLFVSTQPMGSYPAQLQVSLASASIFGSVGVMCFSTPGHHMRKCQHGPPLRTLGARLKTRRIPELTTALPHAN